MAEPTNAAVPETADGAAGTVGRAPEKKMRTLRVRRAQPAGKSKKQVVLSRKPRPGEELSQPVANLGSPSRTKSIRRDAEGHPVARSILGGVDVFEELEVEEAAPEMSFTDPVPATSAPVADAASVAPSMRSSTRSRSDPAAERQKYLGRLKMAMSHAQKVRAEEKQGEQELLELLPISDKFALNSDSKVMALWQERQQDWERLQHNIAVKMGKDPAKMLMGDSNDFREKSEEYQTMLAAVPANERNTGAQWEMSLRNQGSRLVPIGNIFSGLFCPLKADVPMPKVIRRPKPGRLGESQPPPPPAVSGIQVKTWREDRELLHRKRVLRKSLAAVRPHEINAELGNRLVVVSQDLLQWAHDSSKEFFARQEQQHASSGSILAREESALSVAGGPATGASEGAGKQVASQPGNAADASGPRVRLGPSPYVLLESAVKEPVQSALTLQNLGSTTIFYEWKRIEEGPSLVAQSKRGTLEGSCASDPSAMFALSKDTAESRFLCQNASGVLMPGETKATVFAFESSTPGSFSESWMLSMTPSATVLGQLIPSDDGEVTVSLLGAATTTDTNEHCRQPIRRQLERGVNRAELEHVLTQVVREVRTPVREEAVRAAQKEAFETANSALGLNYTTAIFDKLSAMWLRVNEMVPPPEDDDEPLGEWDADIGSIKAVIDRIEVPDEPLVVAEPSGVQSELDASSREPQDSAASGEVSVEGSEREDGPEGDEEEEEDDEGDSEEEDEEEEEEEEEDGAEEEEEEEEEEILNPKQIVDMEWKLLVASAASRPLPPVSSLVVEHVCTLLADAVVDAVDGARTELAISEEDVIQPLPSPFEPFHVPVDTEPSNGAELWAAALDVETEEKTPEQQYRALSHSKLSEKMMALVDKFSESADAVHRDALASYTEGRMQDIKSKSVLRIGEDVRDKRVLMFLNVDVGEYMVNDDYNEYAVPEDLRLPQLVETAKLIKKMLKEGPAHILITGELTAPVPQFDDEKVPDMLELSIKSLQPIFAALLRREVHFCSSVVELNNLMADLDSTAVILLDHTRADTMIPLPEPEEVVVSDDEDDRLPWLGDEKDDPATKVPPPPQRLDLGVALLPFVDVFVNDSASVCVDAKRALASLSGPTVNRVAGPSLHRELIASSAVLDRPKRPILAVVAGDNLFSDVKHIDRMIDVVDEIVVAGKLGLAFLAALGHKTGMAKVDKTHLPMAKNLLAKAQMMGVSVTLPVDYVMGEIAVDANGIIESSTAKEGGEEVEDDEDDDGGADDEENKDAEDEAVDEAAGFDYDGETVECTVSEGLMKRMHALDLGNQTINLVKESMERANTIVWTGLVGVAQCSAFQNGTRELVEAAVQAHEDRNAFVMIGGDELVKWTGLFSGLEENGPVGNGNGVTHAFQSNELAQRVFSMIPAPGVESIGTRQPTEEELMLEEEVRAKRLMDGVVSEEEDEEDEDEDEDGGDDADADDGDY